MTEAALENPLADRDAAMLDFEERWFTLDVPKEQAIMERFGCSTTRYYQRLNMLIDDPAALGYNRCWSSGCAASARSVRPPAPPEGSRDEMRTITGGLITLVVLP